MQDIKYQNTDKINNIKSRLKQKLSDSRYYHTMGVAYAASSLAMKYSVDTDKAFIAGLLHDCVKYMSDEKMLSKAKKHGVEISKIEKNKPDLLHAKLGSLYAKKKYGIDDEEILDAIKYHTTGRPNMSDLEKILYIADYIEPGRNKMPRLDEIRRVAFEDIDECLKMILEDTWNYLNSSDIPIDNTTYEAYKYYVLDNNIKNNDVNSNKSEEIIKENKETFIDGRKDENKRRRFRTRKRNNKSIR